jgi:RimJ/RimL family protein N-acetyltransferase
MHVLHACAPSQHLQDQLPEYENRSASPILRSVSPVCEIVDGNFVLSPVRQIFVEEIAPILKNKKVMKDYGSGHPIGKNAITKMFSRLEQQRYSEPEPTSRGWVIKTHKGVCGVLFTYPSIYSSTTQQVWEIARILALSVQGKGLGGNVLNALFDHFPHMAWSGKSDPDNIASRVSRANVGFVLVETRYDEQDRAIRIFDRRPSNYEIDGRIQIYFSYSGNTVSLASLGEELSLAELLSFTTERTYARPLTLQDLEQENIKAIINDYNSKISASAIVELVFSQEANLKKTCINQLLHHLNVRPIIYGIFKKDSNEFMVLLRIKALKREPSDDLSKKSFRCLLEVDEKCTEKHFRNYYREYRKEITDAFFEHYQNYRLIPRREFDLGSTLFGGIFESENESFISAKMRSILAHKSLRADYIVNTPEAATSLTINKVEGNELSRPPSEVAKIKEKESSPRSVFDDIYEMNGMKL